MRKLQHSGGHGWAPLFYPAPPEAYVAATQDAAGTNYPVIWLAQKYHENPAAMRKQILKVIAALPEEIDTVLVAMGVLRRIWDSIVANRRIVLPRVDDCISLLLHRNDFYHPNLKQMGHMYMIDGDPDKFSPEIMYQGLLARHGKETADYYFDSWFTHYRYLDIVDTGMGNCCSEAFVEMPREAPI